MMTLTMFSFGYWGWGSVTNKMVEAFDVVEAKRGFRPPILVDIRYSRSVRATGFREKALERLVGAARYKWLRGLGNSAMKDGGMMLHDPDAIDELVDLAIEADRDRRRIIFFCACERRRIDGERSCHRDLVAEHMEMAGERRRIKVAAPEWPGGKPTIIALETTSAVRKKVFAGGSNIPVPNLPIAVSAGLAWGSIVELRADGESTPVAVGPARYGKGWELPVLLEPVSPDDRLRDVRADARRVRVEFGWE